MAIAKERSTISSHWRPDRRDVAADDVGSERIFTSDSRFVDTNVLVYLFDGDAEVKGARSREILIAGGNVISTQVLQEFYSATTRKLKVPPAEALQAMEDLTKACRVVTVEVETILNAAVRSERQKLSFWDALIVQAALDAGCRVILSEDLQADRRYEPTLRVENPFQDTKAPRKRKG
jgi:predicted nucleic acid-binding protein